MQVSVQNVPFEVLPLLCEQLESYGSTIQFHSSRSGILIHPSGKLRFEYSDETLKVELIEQAGHFPVKLLIGGIRQMIQEAVEIFRQGNDLSVRT